MGNAEFEAAVHNQCARFAEHFASGDLAGLVAHYYTDDASMLAPSAPVLRGREAIRAGLTSLRDAGFVKATLEPVQLEADRDLGYEIGRVRLTNRASGNAEQVARYVVVWKKCSDGWRVQCDMFAMDAI